MGRNVIEEWLVQSFDRRCPYCDQVLSYEGLDLRPGDNEVTCPSCKRTFIKVISDPWDEGDFG